MKQSIRFFSIGLLTASIVLLGFYFLFGNSKASSKDVPLEEMIEEIESTGHRVVTEKEFIAYTINNEEKEVDKEDSAKEKKESSDKKETKKTDDKTDKKDKKEDKDKKDKKKETNKKEIKKTEKKTEKKDKKENKDKKDKKDKDKKDYKKVKVTITTDDGVVTQEIADKLVEENIIKYKEKQEFLDYLDDNDYSPYIQIGKFKVDSEMSMKELAETFTTYQGN